MYTLDSVRRTADDWTEPGTYEVAPNVYRIPLPLPSDALRAVNVYAITDGDSLTLVDSGWALTEAREALSKAIGAFGADLGDVQQFLVTHVHRDHYTQAVALRDIYGTPISLGEGERPALEALADPDFSPTDRRTSALRYLGADDLIERLVADGISRVRDVEQWKLPDTWLAGDQEIVLGSRTLKVINTPGHTRGHVVFVDEANGLMFAGDHVLPHITPSIGFEAAPTDLPLLNYMESLHLVRRLPEMTLFPAHGSVAASFHLRVDELLAHHDHRLSNAGDAVSAGSHTAYEVASELLWTGRNRPFGSLDPFNQVLAVFETAAHLDVLVLRRDLVIKEVRGVAHYDMHR